MRRIERAATRLALTLAVAASLCAARGAGAAVIQTAPLAPTVTCADDAQPAAGGTLAWAGGAATTTPTVAYVDETGATTEAGALDCAGGTLGEAVERKRKKGSREFMKVTMKDVLVSSYAGDTAGDGPLDLIVDTVLAGLVDGVQVYEHRWDLLLHSVLYDSAGAIVGRATQFLGLSYTSAAPLAETGAWSFDARTGTLVFTAALEDVAGALALRTAPAHAVPEPGTLALLGLLGLGVAALLWSRRRRYGGPPPVAPRPVAWSAGAARRPM